MRLLEFISPETPRARHLMFTVIMAISAPIFGGLQSYRKLRWQDDFLSDMLQVELIIAVGTLIAAFVFWGFLNRKSESKRRGGVAGLLTAICILPLPIFGWSFKTQLAMRLSDSDAGVFSDIMVSFFTSLQFALPIFTSKAIIALPLSFVVGYYVARNKKNDAKALLA